LGLLELGIIECMQCQRSHHIYPGHHHLLLLLLGHDLKDHTRAGDDVEDDQHHNAILRALFFHFMISVFLLPFFTDSSSLYSFNSLAILLAMFLKPIDVPDILLNLTPLRLSLGSLQTSISHWTNESVLGSPWTQSKRNLSLCS